MSAQESFESLRQLEHHIDKPLRLYENREADDYPAHWHSAIELIMPEENTYTVVISEESYHIHPGEILIIPSGVVHEILAPEDGMRYLFLLDAVELLSMQGMGAYQHLLYPCIHLRSDRDPDVLILANTYFVRAVQEYKNGEPLGEAAAKQWLSLLFVCVVRHLGSGKPEQAAQTGWQARTAAVIMDVCAYISAHCNEQLTLEGMAEYCGYSKYHFSRLFKLYTGMGFYDYFLVQRMALCRKHLANPTMSITDVALSSGFGSIATFNRVFKQQEGITPTAYRTMRQQLIHGSEAGKNRQSGETEQQTSCDA